MTGLIQPQTLKTFRFGVAHGDQALSSVWIATAHGNDVYVGTRTSMEGCKVSLHVSRQSRFALNSRYQSRIGETKDRALVKTQRPVTPPIGAVHALSVLFPTIALQALGSAEPGKASKPTTWIKPALPGEAVEIGFFYAREKAASLLPKLQVIGLPFGVFALEGGESVYVVGRYHPFAQDLTTLFAGKAMTPLSGAAEALSPNESLDNLAGILINDPNDAGALSVIQITGLKITRTGQ